MLCTKYTSKIKQFRISKNEVILVNWKRKKKPGLVILTSIRSISGQKILNMMKRDYNYNCKALHIKDMINVNMFVPS